MNPAEFGNIAALEQHFWWFRGMRRILWALLDPLSGNFRGQRWLEAGCGTGHMSACFESRYGCRVVPLDLDAVGLRYAHSAGRHNLIQADIRSLPLAAGQFNAVVSLDVIVHLQRGEELAALQEFARVLVSDGLLVIRAAALDMLHSHHSVFVHERQRFTRRRLTEGLRQAGFRVLRATYVNSLLMPVALAKFRLWEPFTRQPIASGVASPPPWLNQALEWPLLTEAGWLAAGGNLPVGQSVIAIARKEH